jgi:CheY-like chemotaxis protein
VQLDWQTGDDLWCAYADEAQLELALMNLIINARDAMPDGGAIGVSGSNVTVEAEGELGVAPGDYVVLAVSDSGCGIPADIVEQVMEPFFTTKDIGKGTGLGLSMVYGFARQSDGAIRIESRVGQGTRVEIWLPRAPALAAGEQAAAATSVPEPAADRALSILLVDDHPGVRATTAALLEDLGHKVSQSASGAELLDELGGAPGAYDLIVSDYAMPLVSGADVIRRARELAPGMPGIIITGYADVQSIAKRPEDVLVLTKPFTPSQLSAAIRSACPPPG